MCYSQSMARHTCIRLTPTHIYWGRKLDCPTKFHAGHFPLSQRRIFDALAKVLLALSSVVTMTSGLHKSRLGRFFFLTVHLASTLMINILTAIVQPKCIIFFSQRFYSLRVRKHYNASSCKINSNPVCVCVRWTPFFLWKRLTSINRMSSAQTLCICCKFEMDISLGWDVVYQHYMRGYLRCTKFLF